MLKFKLTDVKKIGRNGKELFQIEALCNLDAHGVKKGDKGGFVEEEANLTHFGDCWIAEGASVEGVSMVCDDAYIADRAVVTGNSFISGTSRVEDDAMVSDSKLEGNVAVSGKAVLINSKLEGAIRLADEVRCTLTRLMGDFDILGATELVECLFRGDGILINGRPTIHRTSMGTVENPVYNVHIHDQAKIELVGIQASVVSIGGNASVLDGVKLEGEQIFIRGEAALQGKVTIGSHSVIQELASIEVSKTGGYRVFENIDIHGDTHLVY